VVHLFGGKKLGRKGIHFQALASMSNSIFGQIEEHFGQSSGFGELAMYQWQLGNVGLTIW
jgi:hypothetical protein